MAKKTEFFLGANSANGFYSLYDQLGSIDCTKDFIILKGGPGVGKSTFMKYIGKKAEEKRLDVEYIRCSGDPKSLDAVLIPQLQVIIADGTAPHVLEPKYPAAIDRYVNLGCFYDVERLKERRKEIVACTKGYQAEYEKAYACFRASQAVIGEAEEKLKLCCDAEKICRRMKNIWMRERERKHKGTGIETKRFLGGRTSVGRVWCGDSIYMVCDHIYGMQDSYHLGAPALDELRSMVLKDGYHVISCMDPDCPKRISHLLVPELKVGFVTMDGRFSLSEKSYRKVRVDQMMDQEYYRGMRSGLRLKKRLADALEEEGINYLCAAGEKHEELEQIYHPFVDFDGVLAAAEGECRRIFANV